MKFYINVLAMSFMVSSFLLADLLKPYDGQSISYIHILFEWEQEPDADNYNIQVSANSNFTNLILDLNTSSLVYIFKGDINWGDTYHWRVRPIYNDNSYGNWIDSKNFIITNSQTGFNGIDVNVIDGSQYFEGLTLMGDLSDDNRSIVFDKYGREIWNDRNKNFITTHVNKYGQVSGCSFNNFPDNTGSLINYDNQYLWQGPDDVYIDVHEVKSIPNGNYMGFVWECQNGPIPLGDWTGLYRALGYEADGETLEFPWCGQAIVEWDENSNEIWRWSPFDHFTMDHYDVYGGTWWNAYFDGQYDWMHSNAFHFDSEENEIYFSARHLSRITKVAYPSGDVIWMIGMPPGYYTGNEHICTDLGFTWQHNVQLLDNGNITLFDNGNLSGLFGDSETTRALEFRVIDNSYCEMIWEYTLPNNMFAPWMGSVQTLPNGNKLINSVGSGGHAIEVTPEQQIIWSADYNITANNEPAGNYRTYRIPSIHPNAYAVMFENYKLGDLGRGIYLSDNNLKINLLNESGYEQVYNYSMSDSQGWFQVENQDIVIQPYSNLELNFSASNFNSDITTLNFNIMPTYHTYDSKSYNFSIFKDQLLGDVNGDGGLNVLDVVILVGMILGNNEPTSNADVNEDGVVNVLDVVTLINIILG
tara:strand:+ start:580 stop:2511 length:1932 start_codon:yes stop_codon:yes gene_type:complete